MTRSCSTKHGLYWASPALGLVVLSCVPPGSNDTSLTPAESVAVNAASRSPYAFVEAAGAANVAAAAQSPVAKSTLGTVSVEGCPVLTLSPAAAEGTFNVTIDFGTGCPPPGQTAPVCSGVATGVVNPSGQHLTMTLVNLACESTPALNGTVDLNFTRAEPLITLDGNWDLSFTDGGQTNHIIGPGTVIFDTSAQVVTITQFQGQLIRNGDAFDITMENVLVPLANNPSGLPSGGTIRLSGGLLRQITIRFNENTPSTSIVDVSFFGLFFFPVNLNSLNL